MTEAKNGFFSTVIETQEESTRLTEKLLTVSEPGVVFSKPVKAGEYTLVTASEVFIGLGSGFGYGAGFNDTAAEAQAEGEEMPMLDGGGMGGGGGGYSSGRPVAVISVGPDGVRVEPIIDRTKVGLALASALGSMFFMMSRMRRGR